MEIGVGLPNAIQGTAGSQLLDWATRAERAGFSSVASIGAVSYPSHEELTVFAAVAAVTERVRLMSNVLIAPCRSTAELAKQAATVDLLSNGRLTLGLGVGWRKADFVLTGRDFDDRGAAFDRQLHDLKAAWAGEALEPETRPVCPPPVQNPIPILVGGTTSAAVGRTVEHASGWTAGGMPPDAVGEFAAKVRRCEAPGRRPGARAHHASRR